ncbi:MAG: 50S ribosome-binding GTPase, partial [Deltaproteobacteria bacterium]|nr:50S ribosome-binding GTPase [Deltaproteobacteria bacterium]
MRMSSEEKEDQTGLNRKFGIAVVGNMNVGKTTLFSRMCGEEAQSANIPGNTVAIKTCKI